MSDLETFRSLVEEALMLRMTGGYRPDEDRQWIEWDRRANAALVSLLPQEIPGQQCLF